MTQRTFYDYAHERPNRSEPDLSEYERANLWGYTLHDLECLSRIAVSRARTKGGDYRGRYEAAWSGITDALVTAQDAVDSSDLIMAGWRAVATHVKTEGHHHGYSYDSQGPLVRFDQYWAPHPVRFPEQRIVEQVALWQILGLLSKRQWEVIQALAATGDHALAAQVVGLSDKAYRVQLSLARRRFLAWWHEGETPSGLWRTDRRVFSRDGMCRGKALMTESQVEEARARYHAGETLDVIAADYGYKKAGLSALLTGRSTPVPDRDTA